MSRIAYDPVKDRFAQIIRRFRFLRTLFYKILDLFFLRSWYIRKILRNYGSEMDTQGQWKLLDAGSGFGQYDRFILQEFDNVNVQAVDVKEDYLEDSRRYFERQIKAGRITFNQEDLLKIDFEDTFDFVICVDVLEHIEEDEKVMKNIYRALQTGGYFLMHSPSIYSEEDANGDESFVDEHARPGYSINDISDKLNNSGFAVTEVAYTYGKKGHLAWELIIKYPMLWLNKIKLWALPLMAVYYIPVLPLSLLLMALDVLDNNERGAGIYALAQKQ